MGLNVGNYMLTKMKQSNKNRKWLYEEFNKLLAIEGKETTSYTWFSEKLNQDNLSAHDLIYLSIILEIDFNKVISLCRRQIEEKEKGSVKMMHELSQTEQLMLEKSTNEIEGVKQTFHEKNNVRYLLSYDTSQNYALLETYTFVNGNELKVRSLMKTEALASDIGEYDEDLTSFENMNAGERFDLLLTIGEEYKAMFPDEYADKFVENTYLL